MAIRTRVMDYTFGVLNFHRIAIGRPSVQRSTGSGVDRLSAHARDALRPNGELTLFDKG